ncbi:MAG: hypothetical protein WBM17_06980 [Anaerolineales bacterium]
MSDARIGADFEGKLSQAVRMPVPRPEFVSALRNSFAHAKPSSRKIPVFGISPFRWVVICAGVSAAVLLSAFIALGPERVSALIRNVMGYIPGVGSVSDVSSAWILAKPVEATRDGYTLRVVQAVADDRHVGVRVEVNDSPDSFYQYEDFGAVDITKLRIRPRLRLESGEEIEMRGSSGPGYDDREIIMQFPPMPEGTRSATLVMDILWFEFPSGDSSIVMEFPLQFRAVAEGEVIPVIEIPSAISGDTPAAVESGAPVDLQASASEKGVEFVLEKIIPLGDQTVLAGSYRWSNPEWSFVDALETLPLRLTDGQGREVPIRSYFMEDEIGRNDPGRMPWSVITDPGDYRGPWTLTLGSVEVFLWNEAAFLFDPGVDPRMDQIWRLNQYLNLDGYTLQIVSARLLPFSVEFDGVPDDFALEFEILADHPVWRITLEDSTAHIQGAGIRTEGKITASLYYEKPFSRMAREIHVGYSIELTGPWVIMWG